MTTTRSANRRRFAALPLVICLFIGVVLWVFATLTLATSLKDYTGYTERTTATVARVALQTHHSSSHHGGRAASTTRQYYLDYEASGRSFTNEPLQGVTTGTLHEGDTVVLVYPPGRPGDAVTLMTTSKTTATVERWVGVGLYVLGAGVMGLGVYLVRSSRTSPAPVGYMGVPAASVPGLVSEPSGSSEGQVLLAPLPALVDRGVLPVPWPWEQVVAHLVDAGQDVPFAVVPQTDGGVLVVYEASDGAGRVTCRLRPKEPGRYVRSNTSTLRTQSRQFSSLEIPRWIDGVLAESGWKSGIDGATRIAMVGAAIGVVCAVGGVVIALVVS